MRFRDLRTALLLVPLLCWSAARADDSRLAASDGWLDDGWPERRVDPFDGADPYGPDAADGRRLDRARARERLRREGAGDAWYDALGGHVGVDAIAARFADEDGDTAFRGDGGDGGEPVGLRLRLGVAVEDFLDVELQGALARDGGGGDEPRLDLAVLGAYLKLKLPIGDYIRLVGLGGVAGVGLELTDPGGRVREDERTSLSYGAGLEVALGRRTDLVADWTRYLTEDGDERALDAFGAGIRIRYR